MKNANILAPHLDDAVLSCWHQIEIGARVITLFGGTPDNSSAKAWWDRITSHSDANDTMRARIDENVTALQNTPSAPVNLDYLDFQYRHARRDVDEMSSLVLRSVDDSAPIIAAAGVGSFLRRHPDHITTREVAKRLMEQGEDISFYVDIPYMLPVRQFDNWPERLPKEKLKRILGTDIEVVPHELLVEQQQAKQLAVQAFKSQYPMVNALALGALSQPEAYHWEATLRPI